MRAKKWIKNWFIIILIIPIVVSFNYLIDPLWCFSHQYAFNNVQQGFSERQQKTNYVNFHDINRYDGLLLGSSRTTHINQNDFINMNIFNYALNSMFPYEYKEYIDFFKKKRDKKLKYIIIGADFYSICKPVDIEFEQPKFYIDETESFMYRYRVLFSIDTLKHSITNLKNFYLGTDEYYDRNNIKYALKVSEKERVERYTKNLKRHTESFMKPKYKYNPDLTSIYKSLKQDNPDSKIIIFTSPITADLLVSIIKNGDKMEEYKEWLKELVDIFGSVYNFMDINSITTNLQNYPDDDHYYDDIAKLVAHKIAGVKDNKIPSDFGFILNKNNIDRYLKKLQNDIEGFKR